jgi:hypothetical protein
MLTSNWRNPYLVWDNSTRAELQDALANARVVDNDDDPLVDGIVYSAHEGLVPVGGIYIDIYNEQPDCAIEVGKAHVKNNVRKSNKKCLKTEKVDLINVP